MSVEVAWGVLMGALGASTLVLATADWEYWRARRIVLAVSSRLTS